MRQRKLGVDPLETVFPQRERSKRRRAHGERMNSGANIVKEPRQCQPGGTRAAADGRLSLDDRGVEPGLREKNGGSQAVRPGTDHTSVLSVNVPSPSILVIRAVREIRRSSARQEESTHRSCRASDRKSTRLNSSHGYISS